MAKLEDKIGKNYIKRKHIHNPKPKDFFGLTTYQCGCGAYFTKEQYEKYLKKNKSILIA